MLQQADTVGIFQVESRAQMATLPRLRPEHFYDLVVEVAIIRPGPIVGNMVHPYLARRRGDQPVTYPHPSLEPVLARTLGVPLFQEQLLRMAMVVAGFTGGEAEELRRAMGFKRSVKRMQQIETKLRAGMAAKGITGAAADGIVQSITSFALYGFPESHAASFALLVYASAYLKAHFAAAFYTALLNNQPMGFYHPATLVKDAQRHGVQIRVDRRADLTLVLFHSGRWSRAAGVDVRQGLERRGGEKNRRPPEESESGSAAWNDFVLSLLLEPGRIGVHRGLEICLVAVAVATKRGIEVGVAESLRCGAATQSVRSRLRSGRRLFSASSLLRRRGGQDRAQGART